MWEFLTEWSDDDPKYYLVFIMAGAFFCLLTKEVVKKDTFETTDLYYWSQFLLGAFLILIGVFNILWDIAEIIF